MTLLFLEALGAGLLFILIIWWTMFSGRKNGELPAADQPIADESPSASADNPSQSAQETF